MMVKEHIFWSGSKNVISWLRNESKRLKSFVANRVGQIHDSVSPTRWWHVPGKYNLATHGLTAKEMVNDKEWLFGPSFLYEDPSKWPELHFEGSKEAQGESGANVKDNLLKDIYNLYSLGEKSIDALPKNMIRSDTRFYSQEVQTLRPK